MTAASQEADRRPVTVLFADLSGFTSLAEQLDPEDVRALQTDLFAEMRAALEPLGAFIEKFIGDAVVAVFGAPQAHEDDPERALRAALEMHRRAEALSARWRVRLGSPLALHIGVNTGRVVAGRLGTDPQAGYAVTGDAVNTAARLQSAAQAGETLVSEPTYLLAQHAFSFAPAGPVALKGKAQPVAAYRLLGLADAPRAARGLASLGLSAPLVGRESELAELHAALAGALAGRAQIVGVRGEAGAGKSRLLAEFIAQVQAAAGVPVAVRSAACSPLGEPPYGVMAQFFRQAYGVEPRDPLELARAKIEAGLRALGAGEDEALAVAPMVGYVLGLAPAGALPGIEPERLSRQILSMLRTILERRLAQGPLVLVVEDLHWADSASVEGLRLLADWLADRPLVLLLAYRPTAQPLAAPRAECRELRLAPLSQEHGERMLGAFFGGALSEGLRRQVIERAGGNPLHLEELVRGVVGRGLMVRGQAGWSSAGDAAKLDVPATIEGLLLSRIDRLAPAARHYLQEAAVLWPVFEPALLARIGTAGKEDGASLEALCQAGVLEPATEGAFRFTNALLHDVAYENLLQRRRSELHGCAGAELERVHGPRQQRLEDLEALAHHFSLSDDRARGARYLVAAGDWARRIYANDDALRHFQRALSALAACEHCERETLEVHERLGDLLGLTGRRREALGHYGEVRRSAPERITQARVCRKTGALRWEAGEREAGLAAFREGLALLEEEGEPIERAHLYQEMGRLAFRSGDNQGAVAWAERALGEAESAAGAEAAVAVAQALNTLGVAQARLARNGEAVRHIERSVAIALEHGLLQSACRSYANLGVLYASLDPGRAINTCLTGLDTARKIGDVGFQSRLYANLAVAYCALTDRCDADGLRAAEAAIALDRRLGQIDHLAVPLIVLGQIHQCHGEPARALAYYQEALALAEDIGEPQLLFPCYDGLATLYLDQGDMAQAETYLARAAEVAERAGLDRDSLVVLPFLC